MDVQTYEIKEGIPPPEGDPKGTGKRQGYPWDKLGVGQHFDVPDDMGTFGKSKSNASKRQHNILTNCRAWKQRNKRLEYQIVTRTIEVGDDGKPIVRVWRRPDRPLEDTTETGNGTR